MEYFNAFWVGGLVCVLVQILIENTKLMPGRIMVILVVTGTFLGAFGLFPYLKEYAGVKKAVDEDGFLGLFKGGFTAAATGTSSALIFSYIASLICQPKMKK